MGSQASRLGQPDATEPSSPGHPGPIRADGGTGDRVVLRGKSSMDSTIARGVVSG